MPIVPLIVEILFEMQISSDRLDKMQLIFISIIPPLIKQHLKASLIRSQSYTKTHELVSGLTLFLPVLPLLCGCDGHCGPNVTTASVRLSCLESRTDSTPPYLFLWTAVTPATDNQLQAALQPRAMSASTHWLETRQQGERAEPTGCNCPHELQWKPHADGQSSGFPVR